MDDKAEALNLTPEEQDKLEKAQMVCDTLVTEMEMKINTDKKHCLDSSTLIETVNSQDLELVEIVRSAMRMTKGYFRYHGYPAQVNFTGKEQEHSLEFELIVPLKPENPEITSEE